jgi:DNA-directed RNA polymerase subunit K/omega
MTENTNPEEKKVPIPAILEEASPEEAVIEDTGPQVPKPHERSADVDRKIKGAVDRMLQEVTNPYQTVVVAAQEARRLNEKRLKARSILNQALDQVEELVPDVPFVPRPVEDEEPEVKPTNEALERLAIGIVEFEVGEDRIKAPSYYGGEIDFSLYPEETEGDSEQS